MEKEQALGRSSLDQKVYSNGSGGEPDSYGLLCKRRGIEELHAGRMEPPPQPSQLCEREGGEKRGSCSESQGFSKSFATQTP